MMARPCWGKSPRHKHKTDGRFLRLSFLLHLPISNVLLKWTSLHPLRQGFNAAGARMTFAHAVLFRVRFRLETLEIWILVLPGQDWVVSLPKSLMVYRIYRTYAGNAYSQYSSLATFATHPPLRHAPRRRLNQRLEELRNGAYL